MDTFNLSLLVHDCLENAKLQHNELLKPMKNVPLNLYFDNDYLCNSIILIDNLNINNHESIPMLENICFVYPKCLIRSNISGIAQADKIKFQQLNMYQNIYLSTDLTLFHPSMGVATPKSLSRLHINLNLILKFLNRRELLRKP